MTDLDPFTGLEAIRDAFETWYLRDVCERLPVYEQAHAYYYLDDRANDMWDAWRSAYALAAQIERERCAKVCEKMGDQTINNQEYPRLWHEAVDACIDAIRFEARE